MLAVIRHFRMPPMRIYLIFINSKKVIVFGVEVRLNSPFFVVWLFHVIGVCYSFGHSVYLIGEAYVEGMMDGEAMKALEDGMFVMEEFEIH